MQTFLPYPNFLESANVLDKKRCWKQVIEAKQIIDCIEKKRRFKIVGQPQKIAWENHPAVQMWEGYEAALMNYFNSFLNIAINKHHINTKYMFIDLRYVSGGFIPEMPWWWNKKKFHRAMRARLIEKDRDFYLHLFPEDEGFNDGKYFWPVMDGSKTFKVI